MPTREELERIAREETEAAERIESRRRADTDRAQRDEAQRDRQRSEDAQRAPTAFHRRMPAFALFMLQAVFLMVVGVLWLEGALGVWSGWWAFEALWALALTTLWLDHATWRYMLPYKLIGYDDIHGRDTTPDDYAPFIDVRVVVAGDGDPAVIHAALAVLAARMNRHLADDPDDGPARRWTVEGDAARGEATLSFYTQALLQRWLRRELRWAAAEGGIRRVSVFATYTGRGYQLPSGD